MLSAEVEDHKIESFRDLIVWQRAMRLANVIYDITQTFPREEMFGLTSQMRRSAVSIASNIAEGSQRGSKKDFAQFVTIARGSNAELLTQLLLSLDRKYTTQEAFYEAHQLIDEISRMTMRLIQSLRRTA